MGTVSTSKLTDIGRVNTAHTLLYLMATGHTVAPRSKAPRLNMTQYSLLTHVPCTAAKRRCA